MRGKMVIKEVEQTSFHDEQYALRSPLHDRKRNARLENFMKKHTNNLCTRQSDGAETLSY
jgi:hypothetical protein